jgi:hypothetical protein
VAGRGKGRNPPGATHGSDPLKRNTDAVGPQWRQCGRCPVPGAGSRRGVRHQLADCESHAALAGGTAAGSPPRGGGGGREIPRSSLGVIVGDWTGSGGPLRSRPRPRIPSGRVAVTSCGGQGGCRARPGRQAFGRHTIPRCNGRAAARALRPGPAPPSGEPAPARKWPAGAPGPGRRIRDQRYLRGGFLSLGREARISEAGVALPVRPGRRASAACPHHNRGAFAPLFVRAGAGAGRPAAPAARCLPS